MNVASLLDASANANAVSIYANFDLEPWYSLCKVNEEATNRVTASARQAKDATG